MVKRHVGDLLAHPEQSDRPGQCLLGGSAGAVEGGEPLGCDALHIAAADAALAHADGSAKEAGGDLAGGERHLLYLLTDQGGDLECQLVVVGAGACALPHCGGEHRALRIQRSA